ncbi:hypothetical protein ABK040_006726 [Willaertia magna]
MPAKSSLVNACILKHKDSFWKKIKTFFLCCGYVNKNIQEISANKTDNENCGILSQCQLLLVPPNYSPLSAAVVHYIKDLIDTNKLACVFFRGISTKEPLTKELCYLNNHGYVDWGYSSTFQMNYKILLQQLELTNSFYLNQFLEEYGNEIKNHFETVKPEEVNKTNLPTKIAPMGDFCTGIPLTTLSKPEDWICFATNFTSSALRCAILVHKEHRVLFNHWYALEDSPSKYSKDLTNTMIRYLLFDHGKKFNNLLKEKLRMRILEDFKLTDIEIVLK